MIRATGTVPGRGGIDGAAQQVVCPAPTLASGVHRPSLHPAAVPVEHSQQLTVASPFDLRNEFVHVCIPCSSVDPHRRAGRSFITAPNVHDSPRAQTPSAVMMLSLIHISEPTDG